MQNPCPDCQTLNRAEAKFCVKCGHSLTPAAPVAPPPPPVVPAPPPTPVTGTSQPRLTRPVFEGAPPPYSPPPYTPPRQDALKGMSRGQMLFLLGFAIVVVAALIVVAAFLLFRQAPLKSTVTPTLKATSEPVASPVHTPGPAATHVPLPTSTPPRLLTPSSYAEEVETVRSGDTLYKICLNHCGVDAFREPGSLDKYAHEVADRNNLPWLLDQDPILAVGKQLIMLPCPPKK